MNTLDDELNSDGDCSLREAVQAANSDSAVDNCGTGSGADTITLGFGTFQLSVTGSGEDGNETGDLDITGDLTITGIGIGGTAINALGQDRGFDVHAGTVVLSSLKVQNGRVSSEPDDGGNVRNKATLTVSDFRVEDGTATGAGGGIFNAPNATLVISNSEVTSAPTGNRASAGGGLSNGGNAMINNSTFSGNSTLVGGSGGGVHNSPEGTMTIDGSTIAGNEGGVNGGGVLNGQGGTMDISNSLVMSNTASDHGGIANDGSLTIHGTTIRQNHGTGGGCGGGIWNTGDISIDGATIDRNTHGCGAGLFNTGTATLSNSAVAQNHALSGGSGGIGNTGNLTITNGTTITGNSASDGGGISNFGSMTLDGSSVSGNTVGGGGGGISDNGTSTITNSTIEDNAASSNGCCGGAGLEVGGSGSTTLDGVTVQENVSYEEGGGIFVFGELRTVNTIVTANNATANGGGVHVDSGAKLSMIGGEVLFNHATAGGGISSEGPCVPCNQPLAGTASLDGVAVTNNTAERGGGLYLFNGTEVELSNSTVTRSTVTGSGGGILNSGSTLGITGGSVSDNTAWDGPGGIDNHGSLSVADTTISGNSQTRGCCGGGVGNTGNATIHSSTVVLNAAENGAGIYNTGSLKVTDTFIQSNTATCCGGGLSNEHSGTATLDNVYVNSNRTDDNGSGGGIYNFLSGALTMRDSTVGFNQARQGGGILNGDGGAVSIIRSQISSNSGFMTGGGIANVPFGNTPTLTIEESTISGNSSAQGAGIHSDGTLTVEKSTLSGNSSDGGSAGGLQNIGTATVVNSTISANTATFTGGGIENRPDGTLALRSVTLTENSAASGPGLANSSGAVATMRNSILANSTGGGECDGNVTSQGYNLIEDPTSCTIGGDTTGNVTGLDPMLGPLDNNGGPTMTHALLLASPAIDAGSPSCPPPATDQRGQIRPQGTGCDIGAVESSSADLALTKTDPPGRAPTGRNLTYTLRVVNNGPDAASEVSVIDFLPPTTTLVSVNSPGPGPCSTDGSVVECGLGTLASGAMVTVEIVVKPTEPGVITNTASVRASTPDPNEENNSDSESTTVCRITSRRSSIPCP